MEKVKYFKFPNVQSVKYESYIIFHNDILPDNDFPYFKITAK